MTDQDGAISHQQDRCSEAFIQSDGSADSRTNARGTVWSALSCRPCPVGPVGPQCNSGQVQIGILGPLEVLVDGHAVVIAGARLRALVTRLALDAPHPVSAADLADAVWPADPPADPLNALQSLISRVRRVLAEPGAIQQMAGGYRLNVDRGAVDVGAFGDLVATGRRYLRDGAAPAARDTLSIALDLWRGTPLIDAGDADYAVGPTARLQEQRLETLADRIEAELLLGRAGDVTGELESLVLANPLRERYASLLMRALAATGRTADALGTYERLRDRLAGDLGVDPGPDVQAVQLAVLRGEIPSAAHPGAAGRRRSNLRASLTSFIGREDELARVSGLLETGRLVTIVGPGGAGKTRLANEIAAKWIPRRSDGVWLIELAPVSDEKAIAQAMLGALGLLDTRAVEPRMDRQVRDSTDHLIDVLSQADCLLLVDNCEHLIGPVAVLVDQLLANCPDVRILTTSREPLGIVGEALCVLPPLGLPPVDVSASDAADHQSVRLFIERAQAVSAVFAIDDSTVGPVTEIVRRLDGLPLAIELAAARLRVMPTSEIAARLSDRFRLLTGGSRTAVPRHRTLRAVVEWSWQLLAPDERLLAERLAVFPAGASAETARAVCGDSRLLAADIDDLLLALVDKSLLTVINGSSVRFRMLETIREYGVERLAERGEAQAVRMAHARYFAQVAARLDPVLRTADQLPAIETLNAERDNIIAALRFLAESDEPDDRAGSLDLAMSMSWYWAMIGADAESAVWLALAVAATDGLDHPGRLWAKSALSIVELSMEGRHSNVTWEEIQGQCRTLAAQLENAPPPQNPALVILAPMLSYFGGDLERAERFMESILCSADGWIRAAARIGRAGFAENEGNLDRVRVDIDAAYEDFVRIGDRWGLSSVLAARGNVRALDGDVEGGISDYEQALRYVQELGSAADNTFIQLQLAGLRMRAGDTAGARRTIEQVRAEIAGRSQGLERGLFADGLLISIVIQEGDLETAQAMAATVRERLTHGPVDFLHGHVASIVGAITAQVAVRVGDLELAIADLVSTYPIAVATTDMPIVAVVGVSIAWLADALGCAAEAAAILGASARLRGSDDLADPMVANLIDTLRTTLGSSFDENYRSGKALDRADAIALLDPTRFAAALVEVNR